MNALRAPCRRARDLQHSCPCLLERLQKACCAGLRRLALSHGQLWAVRAWRQNLLAHTKRATRGLEERYAGCKSEETVVLVGNFRVSLCRYSSLVGSCDHSYCAMYAAVYITTGHARTVKSTRIYSRAHMDAG